MHRQSLTRLLPRRQITTPPHETPQQAQSDRQACQQATKHLKQRVHQLRRQHLAFQQARRRCRTDQLDQRDDLQLQLNPIRTWVRLTSRWLLDEVEPPANVLFFAAPGGPSAAMLELEGQALLNELEDWQPCTLREWAALSQLADPSQLVDFCRDLVDMGIAAWLPPVDKNEEDSRAQRRRGPQLKGKTGIEPQGEKQPLEALSRLKNIE